MAECKHGPELDGMFLEAATTPTSLWSSCSWYGGYFWKLIGCPVLLRICTLDFIPDSTVFEVNVSDF
ncbi:hypothetical protein Dda_4668 [Drechslerella dactyloides]|uniref:Uncharacterized protein n=1 Tax=Drechslerella dactyloides TaxID=74499 RepID=A0AAD6J1Q7_DREDA|nr:hypothetical protein Dda_4668 [Drechslerella dactyloides]